ncbi:MAG: IS3 family transposase [Candidatus Accumulibacter cognatus]|uniref:IS3 family transposase n=1 Tax=Candidatus Accumulibacter cognatus TaxID=2954383 RepID=A0A7D5SF70_9PROT|nr:MAG: IS3 family transposase [Candidatus Accumulibacter cognatus]
MTRRTRRNHTPAFKAQVSLAALKSDKTLAELAQQYDLHPNQITDWKRQLTERAVQVFGDTGSPTNSDPDLTKLHAKIGQLTLENGFFRTCAHPGGPAERKTMIDRNHKLPVSHQCPLLGLARSTAYYTPREVSAEDLALMRRIDELHLDHPFAGARMLRDLLRPEGFEAGRKHIGTLMARMGIEALYRKPHTSRRQRGDEIHPYLLRGLAIERPNQAWAADITYIPMRRGFLYLFAVIDGFSRRVLAWRLSNTLTTDFCLDAVREAIHRHGCPEIFNTDQGGQFTSGEFTGLLKAHDIRISMDGKGSWRDNVFVERLWKSVKYEEGYLKAYDNVADAKANLATYLRFYNERRPHRSREGKTPDVAYFVALASATPGAA